MSTTITVRPPREDEAGEIAAIINAASQAESGVDDVNEREIRRWFGLPHLDVARDVFIAEEAGAPVAYGDVSNEGDAFEQFWLDVRLPQEVSETAGDALLAAVERRAEEMAAQGPAGKDARLVAGASSVNARLAGLLERRGFRQYRQSYRMEIELEAEPAEPRVPAGIDVRTFRPGEERAVFHVVDEAFEDSWDHVPMVFEEWRYWMSTSEDFDPALWWLATEGDEIAGVCLCRRHEIERDMGWVQSLAVRRPWRRRGLARALLLASFVEFKSRGFARGGLGVDADSRTGAHLLYESAGMRPVRRFDLYEKPLA